MEKLIKLLNEYCKEKKYDTVWYEKGGLLKFEPTKRLTQGVISGIVISKHYGFIERLVKKDKIDLQKVMERNKNGYDITRVNPDDNFIDNAIEYDDELDLFIIMLLAISDNPIQDLIDLLN